MNIHYFPLHFITRENSKKLLNSQMIKLSSSLYNSFVLYVYHFIQSIELLIKNFNSAFYNLHHFDPKL